MAYSYAPFDSPEYTYSQGLAQPSAPVYYNQPVTIGPSTTERVWEVPPFGMQSQGYWTGQVTPGEISGGEGISHEDRLAKGSPAYTSDFEKNMRLYGVDEMQAQDEYQRGLLGENLGQFQQHAGAFQDYSQNQFKGLFDMITQLQNNQNPSATVIPPVAQEPINHRANMPTIGMPQAGSNPALSGFGGGGGRLIGQGWGTHPAFKGLLAGGGE